MASSHIVSLRVDSSQIDEIVRLLCMAFDCKHNTVNCGRGISAARCCLKYIVIDERGMCRSYVPSQPPRMAND